MNAEAPTHPAILDSGQSRQVTRRALFQGHFPAYPGWVMGHAGRSGRVSAHSKYGQFMSRKERRNLARAFAAGEWRKRNDVALAVA